MTATASHLPALPLPLGVRCIKRAIDLLVGIIFLVPLVVLLIINGCYYLRHGGSWPLVGEQRIGRNGPFTFYKLRTRLPNGRSTGFGEFFRHWGLDEVGQILNILKGDMSLVGPRPVEPEKHDRCLRANPRFRERYAVRPGLLGLGIGIVTNRLCAAQKLDDTELRRLVYDLRYVHEWSVGLEFTAMRVSLADILRGHEPIP